MYTLIDTHNQSTISRHHTLAAAAKARKAHSAGVKRYNGPNSYIPTELLDANGEVIRPGHAEYDAWADAIDATFYGE